MFTRTGGSWSQQAYLKASNLAGCSGTVLSSQATRWLSELRLRSMRRASMAISGQQPIRRSRLCLYAHAGVWTQEAYLKASNTDAGDRFGQGLGLDGDTLVVGARFEASAASGVNADQTDNSAPNAGAVYVFTRTGGVWSSRPISKLRTLEQKEFRRQRGNPWRSHSGWFTARG